MAGGLFRPEAQVPPKQQHCTKSRTFLFKWCFFFIFVSYQGLQNVPFFGFLNKNQTSLLNAPLPHCYDGWEQQGGSLGFGHPLFVWNLLGSRRQGAVDACNTGRHTVWTGHIVIFSLMELGMGYLSVQLTGLYWVVLVTDNFRGQCFQGLSWISVAAGLRGDQELFSHVVDVTWMWFPMCRLSTVRSAHQTETCMWHQHHGTSIPWSLSGLWQ